MDSIKLIKPEIKYEAQILDYRAEFKDNNENMSGSAGLEYFKNIKDWIASVDENSREDTVKEGLVPANEYLAIIENEIIGMINIRHRLNDYLLNIGGHIGYSVRKSERLKGYATKILSLGLIECKQMNIENVLITCDKDNIGSSKTIVKNGGKLENEVNENGKIIERYWIKLGI